MSVSASNSTESGIIVKKVSSIAAIPYKILQSPVGDRYLWPVINVCSWLKPTHSTETRIE